MYIACIYNGYSMYTAFLHHICYLLSVCITHFCMWCSTSAVQCSTPLLELNCITDAGHGISEMLLHTAHSQPPFCSTCSYPPCH